MYQLTTCQPAIQQRNPTNQPICQYVGPLPAYLANVSTYQANLMSYKYYYFHEVNWNW